MRYYSTTAGEMVLQAGIAAGDTTIVVDTTSGLPVTFPYTLLLDYGQASEEVVNVTAAGGTTLTVERGQDGTVAQAHDFGAKIRHGVTARDFRESREHEAATAAHGVGEVVGTDEAQTLDNKDFTPAADHAAVTVRTVTANTEPALDLRDETDARRAGWFESSLKFFYGSNTVLTVLQGGAVNLFKKILDVRVSDDIHAITGTVSGTPTGRFLRLMSGASELFSVAANGDVTAQDGTFAGDVAATGNVTGANIVTLSSDVAGHETRLDTLEGQTLDTRLDAVEANLGSQTTFAATSASKDGKRMHWGTATVTTSGPGLANVTHGAGFTPSVVVVTGVDKTWRLMVDTFGATTFRLRTFDGDGNLYNLSNVQITYFCGE